MIHQPPNPTPDAISDRLAQTARAVRQTQRLERLASALWIWFAALLAVILVDAVWPLGPQTRAFLSFSAIVGLIAAILRVRLAPDDTARAVLRQASGVEHVHGLGLNPLVNAIWLRQQQTAGGATNSELASALTARAIAQGEAALEQADLSAAVDRQPMKRQGRRLLVVVAGWCALLLLWTALVTGGIARLADPWGDHPPFSLTRFDVALPEPVHAGQDATVRVTLAGELPENVEFVELDKAGAEIGRWPMDRVDAHRFERRLHGLRQDVRFRVAAESGFSHRYGLNILPPEPVKTASSTPEQPGEDATSPGTQPSTQPTPAGGNPSTHDNLANVAAGIGQMAETARWLDDASKKLAAKSPGQAQPEDADTLKEMERAMEWFKQRAEALAGQCQAMSQSDSNGGLPEADRQRMSRTAQMLKRLQLPSVSPSPKSSPGQNGSAAGQWLGQTAEAAQHDLSDLQRQADQVSQMASGYQSNATANQTPTKDPGVTPGTTVETGGPSHHPTAEMTALMKQVPQTYRDMVQQYFDRVVHDQSR